MFHKSYWLRLYDLIFNGILISTIFYLVTTLISLENNLQIILENIIVISILFFGIQVDYYLHKIGILKGRENKFIAIISLCMIIISYGIIDLIVNYLKAKEDIPPNLGLESPLLLMGLLGWGVTVIFGFYYYRNEIISYFQLKSYFQKIYLFNFERCYVLKCVMPIFVLLFDIVLIVFYSLYLLKLIINIPEIYIGLLIVFILFVGLLFMRKYEYTLIYNLK